MEEFCKKGQTRHNPSHPAVFINRLRSFTCSTQTGLKTKTGTLSCLTGAACWQPFFRIPTGHGRSSSTVMKVESWSPTRILKALKMQPSVPTQFWPVRRAGMYVRIPLAAPTGHHKNPTQTEKRPMVAKMENHLSRSSVRHRESGST